MARPKGSKNKPKVKPVKFEQKADVVAPVKVEKSPVEWKPEPDMGSIKPPAEAEKDCAGCLHKGTKHYGGPKGWCNVGDCRCQEFK